MAVDSQPSPTAKSNKREKRSFWPFGSDATAEADTIDNETETEVETAAGIPLPIPQSIPPQQIRLPAPLHAQLNGVPYAVPGHVAGAIGQPQNNLHYPIYRVHKFNGIHLNPLPISLIAQSQFDVNGQPGVYTVGGGAVGAAPQQIAVPGIENNLVEPEKVPAKVPVNTITTSTENDDDKDNEETDKPAKPLGDLKVTPELLKLAKRLGIKDISKLPSLDDAAGLLGTTTQEETVQVIMELAETEDGLALIKQYLNTDNGDDSEAAASDSVGEYIVPRENTEDVQESSVVEALAADPVRNLDATLDRTRVSLGLLQPYAPTPAPTFLGRIAQFTSILNPFAGREESEIPPIGEADAVEINDDDAEKEAEGVAIEEEPIVVDNNSIPVPELPELSPLPGIGALEPQSVQVPQLPVIHLPAGYTLPPGYAQSGGPYIRVKLPLNGFNPTPQYQIPAQYLNHYQNQLALRGAHLPSTFAAFGASQPIGFTAPQPAAAVNVVNGVNAAGQTVAIAGRVNPVVPFSHGGHVEAPHAAHTVHVATPPASVRVAPSASFAPQPSVDLELPVATAPAAQPDQASVSVNAPHAAVQVTRTTGPNGSHSFSIRAPSTSVDVTRPSTDLVLPLTPVEPSTNSGADISVNAPHTAVHVSHPNGPHGGHTFSIRAPFTSVDVTRPSAPQILPSVNVRTPFATVNVARPASAERISHFRQSALADTVNASHVGHLPLADTNYEAFRNAPRIVTSYGTPALPFTFPEDKTNVAWPAPASTSRNDLPTAASERHEHIVPAARAVPHAKGIASVAQETKSIAVPAETVAAPTAHIAEATEAADTNKSIELQRSTTAEASDIVGTLSALTAQSATNPDESSAAIVPATKSVEAIATSTIDGAEQTTTDEHTARRAGESVEGTTATVANESIRAAAIAEAEKALTMPAVGVTSTTSRPSRRRMAERRRNSNHASEHSHIQRIAKPQRSSGYEAYATGKVHTADPEVVNMLPITMQQTIQRHRSVQ